MKLKKIILSFSKEDIVNFLSLQNKVQINKVVINDNIHLYGEFPFLKMNIKFECRFDFENIVQNKIYININSFKVLNTNIINAVSKKIFNFVIKAFSEVEAVKFDGHHFTLDIEAISKKYDNDFEGIDISKLEAKSVEIKNHEVEVSFGGIKFDTNILNTSNEEKVEEVVAEIVTNTDGEEIHLTLEEIKGYEKEFNEDNFFSKIKNYGKIAGVSSVYATLILYYTYKDKTVPISAKAISLGALGYFILPTDLVPDILIGVGYTDDYIALITAIQSITMYVNDDIKLNARRRLDEWFDNVEDKDLEKINQYLNYCSNN